MDVFICLQRPEDIEDDSDVEYVEYEDEYDKCKYICTYKVHVYLQSSLGTTSFPGLPLVLPFSSE